MPISSPSHFPTLLNSTARFWVPAHHIRTSCTHVKNSVMEYLTTYYLPTSSSTIPITDPRPLNPQPSLHLSYVKLHRFVSLISCNTVPINIFTRGFQKLPEWNAEGKLVDRFPSSMVLHLLAKLFGDMSFQDGVELHSQMCSFLRTTPDIILTGSKMDAHISVTNINQQKILETLPKEDRIEISFDILNLIVHGFPEPDTEIAPRLGEQYLPVVRSTCLPFLETVHFDDIISYCQGTHDNINDISAQLDYLIALWGFLQRVTRVSQQGLSKRVQYLEHQIETHIFSIISKDHLRTCTYLKASTAIAQALQDNSLQRLQDSIKKYQSDHEPRINAIIGMAILSAIGQTTPLINSWNPAVWMPLEKDIWSCFERYVLILARGQYSPSIIQELPLQIEVLIAFEMARIGQFSVAQEVLLRRISEVQKRYGSGSAEFIACGIELVLCCNFLAEPVLGEIWAKKIGISAAPYLQLDSKTYYASEFNLHLAAVDAKIGQGQYNCASKELQKLLNLENLPSRCVLMVTLRLLKSIRRQGNSEFDKVVWDSYEQALQHAAHVSDFLKHELFLEALCLFSVFSKLGCSSERIQTLLELTIAMIEQLLDQPEKSKSTTILKGHLESLYGYQAVLKGGFVEPLLLFSKLATPTTITSESKSQNSSRSSKSHANDYFSMTTYIHPQKMNYPITYPENYATYHQKSNKNQRLDQAYQMNLWTYATQDQDITWAERWERQGYEGSN